MVWALLLSLELARLVSVSLLLRHLLILSLGTSFLMILLPHDVFSSLFFLFSFGALYSGQTCCVYMGCTDTDFCIYGICSLWTVFVVMYFWTYVWMCLWTCIYGFVFLDLYLWLCVYGYVYLGVFGYVFGYVYGYRVSILREARFNKYRGLPLLGALLHH